MKFLIMIFIGVSCSSNRGALSESARNLEVYANKPMNCVVSGKVIGIDDNGSTELATNHALNQAAELKATGIFVNQEVPNGKKREVHATAYKCD